MPFRPENNSPFFRHYFTHALLLCLIAFIICLPEKKATPAGEFFREKSTPDSHPGRFGANVYWGAEAVSAALAASAAALAFSAWAFLMALYFSFSSAVAMGRMASLGQTLVHSLQPLHLS